MLHIFGSVVAASLLVQVQSGGWPPVYNGMRQVVFLNNTRVPIVEIYVSDDTHYLSDDNHDNWQEDLLGYEFLLPNASVPVYIDDQNRNCRVDLKVVLDNGSTLVNRGLNICVAENKPIPIR